MRPGLLAAFALTALAAACTTTDVTEPEPNLAGGLTVDASTGWAYVNLEDGAAVTPAPSADGSTAWDIGFSTTSVAINGGSAGPAGMTAFCICQNASSTNEQFLAMTADGEKGDFDAVKSVPGNATFTADVFGTQRWYRYNLAGDNRVTPTFDVYLVKRGTSVYKVQITNYYGPTGAPRQISFRYERIVQ